MGELSVIDTGDGVLDGSGGREVAEDGAVTAKVRERGDDVEAGAERLEARDRVWLCRVQRRAIPLGPEAALGDERDSDLVVYGVVTCVEEDVVSTAVPVGQG